MENKPHANRWRIWDSEIFQVQDCFLWCFILTEFRRWPGMEMPRMGNTMAVQSQIWRTPKPQGGDNPYKSGLSVRLPGMSPGLSGRDHEGSCGCSSISVYQLMGSDKGSTHCGEWKQFCRCLGPLPDFTSSRKTKGSLWCFFSASRIPAIVLFFCFSHHHRPWCSDNSWTPGVKRIFTSEDLDCTVGRNYLWSVVSERNSFRGCVRTRRGNISHSSLES